MKKLDSIFRWNKPFHCRIAVLFSFYTEF